MKATVHVVYGIGNAVRIELESLEGAEETLSFEAFANNERIFVGHIEHPPVVGDFLENGNLKATLGFDNVTARVAGVSVDLDTEIGEGTTTIVLEDVQSEKN